MIGAQCNWGQPKLTHHTLVAYMNMRRFMGIKAGEEQAIWSWDIGNRGHAVRLTPSQDNESGAPQYT